MQEAHTMVIRMYSSWTEYEVAAQHSQIALLVSRRIWQQTQQAIVLANSGNLDRHTQTNILFLNFQAIQTDKNFRVMQGGLIVGRRRCQVTPYGARYHV